MNKLFVMLLAGACAAGTAEAQEKTAFKLADTNPPGHYLAVEASQFFMDKVKDSLGERVEFQYYPSQQLGKAQDVLRILRSGVADIAYVPVGSLPDQLPLSGVGGLPGLYESACDGTEAISKISREGLISTAEFDKAGVKVIFAFAVATYKLLSRQDVKEIDDIGGLKIRTASSAQDETVRAFGGVAVRMPVAEVYTSVTRGTVDGILFPYSSARAYDIHTPSTLPHVVEGVTFGSATVVYAMDKRRWERLPAEVREALDAAGRLTEENVCKYADNEESSVREAMVASGVKIVEIAEENRGEWRSRFGNVWQAWSATLDTAGHPASDVLKEFQSALSQTQ